MRQEGKEGELLMESDKDSTEDAEVSEDEVPMDLPSLPQEYEVDTAVHMSWCLKHLSATCPEAMQNLVNLGKEGSRI